MRYIIKIVVIDVVPAVANSPPVSSQLTVNETLGDGFKSEMIIMIIFDSWRPIAVASESTIIPDAIVVLTSFDEDKYQGYDDHAK